jgi:hypothetical protein
LEQKDDGRKSPASQSRMHGPGSRAFADAEHLADSCEAIFRQVVYLVRNLTDVPPVVGDEDDDSRLVPLHAPRRRWYVDAVLQEKKKISC